LPVYYFPRADVRMDLFEPTDHQTFCPYKGKASYWTVKIGNRVAENAVWGYPDPYDEVTQLKDFVAFYWDRVDHWYEEDDEIFVHPRDPYKRVDVVDSSRRAELIVGRETVAERRTAANRQYAVSGRAQARICGVRARAGARRAATSMFFVYLVCSKPHGTLYVGVTSDLPKRV